MRYRTLLLSGLMLASPAQALDIEPITIRSALGQPLLAEIPIEATEDELRDLRAGLAPAVVFARVGLTRPQGTVAGLRFAVVDARNGPLIRITTDAPVSETFFTFLVQLEWSSGKMIREFSVALQEPASMPVAQLPAITPPQQAPTMPASTGAGAAETAATPPPVAAVAPIAPIALAVPAAEAAPVELNVPVAEVAPIALAGPAGEPAPIPLAARPTAPSPAPSRSLPETTAAPVAAIPLRQSPPAAPSPPSSRPMSRATSNASPALASAGDGKAAPRAEPPPTTSSASSPVASIPAGGRRYGPVRPGEALSRIAAQVDEAGTRHEQALAALLLANPDAFIGGNINRLKRGAVLRLPSASELASIQAAHAQRLVHLQIRAWHEGPDAVADAEMAAARAAVEADMAAAAAAARVVPDSGRLEITPPGPEASDESTAQPRPPDIAMSAAAADDEAIASREAEIEHLRQRVAELEGSSEEMQRVIAIQDEALAKAQQRLAQRGGDGGGLVIARSSWPWAAAVALLLAGVAGALKYRRARLADGGSPSTGSRWPRWHRP
ncbi:FimV/HubP family polar landmark protein [Marilutibacter chinensis]|uniref:FimV N-terminal domain-containing protein n=1 Tax=Marilutibacter chinensis TaxID=2912247 RepID=A0ABS9HTX2_9GAMM|nr:FimV/HubP family polar landmark protein [Lysobacter chinensis]MCF7221674.1 hypothetical protein [Lysobacter chinensis]